MARALRIGVYAFSTGLFICTQGISTHALAKDGKEPGSSNSSSNVKTVPSTEFQWKDHNRLSWEDFRGPVNADNDESAAATHCGIGFKMSKNAVTGIPEVVVYNTFYVNKSWVRSDAKIGSILDHEQGHFDLCELYTRKLKSRIAQFDLSVPGVRTSLMKVFTEVNTEYETCQQTYEAETTHGTNIPEQRKWQARINHELN